MICRLDAVFCLPFLTTIDFSFLPLRSRLVCHSLQSPVFVFQSYFCVHSFCKYIERLWLLVLASCGVVFVHPIWTIVSLLNTQKKRVDTLFIVFPEVAKLI